MSQAEEQQKEKPNATHLSTHDTLLYVSLPPTPPFLFHLCSSTRPLTSQANSTCLTPPSVLWCEEREALTTASQGERKRDEEGVEGTGKEEPITLFPSPEKPMRLFHCLYTELLRELLAEEGAEKHSTCTFFKSQDYLAIRCL